MKEIEVNPFEVYAYHAFSGVSVSLVEKLMQTGWEGIPRVPVFEIPKSLRGGEEFQFILADGNHRRNAAAYLGIPLPVMLYKPHEKVLTVSHKLAPFTHSKSPRLYERLMQFYGVRKEQARIVRDMLVLSPF